MLNKNCVLISLVAIFGCIVAAQAQQNCMEVMGQPWNNTELVNRTWFEVGRNPAPSSSLTCAQVHILWSDETQNFTFYSSYSTDEASYTMDQTQSSIVALNSTDAKNALYIEFDPSAYYKILNVNSSWAYGCGYSNSSDVSTEFGFILADRRVVNESTLWQLNNEIALEYSAFKNGSLTLIVQSDSCRGSGAAKLFSSLSAFLAILFTLLKVF